MIEGEGVTGWPFWPKHQPFHCQRAQCGMGSNRRRQIFYRHEGYKGNFVSSELRDCMYKGSQGPARHFVSQKKWQNYYSSGTKCEKGPTQFRCKYQSNYRKRDENIKVRKNSGTAHTLIRLGPISIDGNSCACFKGEQCNSEGVWEALTSFDKNKHMKRRKNYNIYIYIYY